jgi:hypothetical protein
MILTIMENSNEHLTFHVTEIQISCKQTTMIKKFDVTFYFYTRLLLTIYNVDCLNG